MKNHKSKVSSETTKSEIKGKSKLSSGQFRQKEFIIRKSVLTELYEINHIQTIYNIFIVILIILFLNTAIYDYVENGSIRLGFTLIYKGFGKFHIAIAIWATMILYTLSLHKLFSIWARCRIKLFPKSIGLYAWDRGCLCTFVCYQLALLCLPVVAVIRYDVSPVSSLAVLMEQVRLLMKSHAFVRSNAPRVLSQKSNDEDNKTPVVPYSKFVYFLFAPTLLYRDEYPRTKTRNIKQAIWNFTEVILVIFYVSFIFERFFIPSYHNFGAEPIKFKTLVMLLCGSLMPGGLAFVCGFYCVLHSWMNAWAELLYFGDRLFYKDWWNATSFSVYYRSWNLVVHDWLYQFIYKDFSEIIFPGQRNFSTFMVFIISALVHEYILGFAFGFLYPALTIFFLFSVIFVHIPVKVGNVLLWWSLITGSGILFSLYSIEFFSRENCPPVFNYFWDLIIPRSWVSNAITF